MPGRITLAVAALVAALLFVAAFICARAAHASNCAATSVGFVPLIDLGAGTYHGFPGGLYPGATNVRPPAHDSAGLAIARAIVPLDTLGNPDPANGRIVLISIGMSNATQEFSTFVPLATSDPGRNPRLNVIDCAEGGQATQDIRTAGAPYWDTVAARLRAHGSAPLQAQVAWIKEARRSPTEPFPASADSLTNDLGTIVRILHAKLPNLRIAYLTSRIYAGYATGVSTLNPEPYAYESGFAVRWLIGAQIAGVDSLAFDPAHGPVQSPWLSWGPYLWADGLNPRSDGLVWHCADFVSDGTHPSTSGRTVVADSLLAFFHRESTSMPWFVSHATVSVEEHTTGTGIAVTPNPGLAAIDIAFTPERGAPWRLEILDLGGRRVRALARGSGGAAPLALRWDGRDDAGQTVRAGIYWARLTSGGRTRSARIAWLAGR